MKRTIKVACAIIEKNGNILVAQRSEKMDNSLKWEFPGGKVEDGEDLIQCIKREIQEELGIDINIIRSLNVSPFDKPDRIIELYPFVCEYADGEITLLEHKEVIWHKPENLHLVDFAESDIPILHDYLIYISQKKLTTDKNR